MCSDHNANSRRDLAATPTGERRRILLLGGGSWQAPFWQRAREMGLYVCGTDWDASAEAKPYADVFAPIDLTDVEATVRFARQQGVQGVFTAAEVGVRTAAVVAARLGLPYHSEELAMQATDKFAMRTRAVECHIPQPRFVATTDVRHAVCGATQCGFPVIVKPADNCGSRGVSYAADAAAVQVAFESALAASRSGVVLVEEFIAGMEGSAEAVVTNGQALVLGICDKIKSALPWRYDLQLVYPGDYSPRQLDALHRFVQRLVEGFAVRNGVLHVEFSVRGEQVRLIEFALRPCGSHVVSKLLPAMLGVDIMRCLLLGALGEATELAPTRQAAGVLRFVMLASRRIHSITGLDAARAVPGVVDVRVDRQAGEFVEPVKDGRGRPGYILATGGSREEALAAADAAEQRICVTYD